VTNREIAVQYRLEGKGYSWIAKKLDVPVATVWEWVAAECIYPDTRQLLHTERAVVMAQLDRAIGTVWEIVGKGTHADQSKALGNLVALLTRKCKMMGIDAPEQIAAIVTDGKSLEDSPLKAQEELQKLIGHIGPKGEAE
jgi:hypothetical protein